MSSTEQGLIGNGDSQACGLRFVVALKPEANPVIERFALRAVASAAPFRCWKNVDGDCWLVISGIGKTSAASAAAWLHAVSGANPAAVWVNLGIAGHPSAEPGEIRRVHKITDAGTGRSWFPPLVIGGECGLESVALITIDRPAKVFPDDGSLVDMEASGFVETVSRFTTLELVHCLKVVSDNAETGFDNLKGNRNRVQELVGSLVERADQSGFFSALKVALDDEVQRLADPEGFLGLIGKLHFTESQTHQLRRLLVRCEALGIDVDSVSSGGDGRAVLKKIQSMLLQRGAV